MHGVVLMGERPVKLDALPSEDSSDGEEAEPTVRTPGPSVFPWSPLRGAAVSPLSPLRGAANRLSLYFPVMCNPSLYIGVPHNNLDALPSEDSSEGGETAEPAVRIPGTLRKDTPSPEALHPPQQRVDGLGVRIPGRMPEACVLHPCSSQSRATPLRWSPSSPRAPERGIERWRGGSGADGEDTRPC